MRIAATCLLLASIGCKGKSDPPANDTQRKATQAKNTQGQRLPATQSEPPIPSDDPPMISPAFTIPLGNGRPMYWSYCRKEALFALSSLPEGSGTVIYRLDLEAKEASPLSTLEVSPFGLAFSADCSQLLALVQESKKENTAALWSLKDPKAPKLGHTFRDDPSRAHFDETGTRVAIANDESVHVYQVSDGSELGSVAYQTVPGDFPMDLVMQSGRILLSFYKGRLLTFDVAEDGKVSSGSAKALSAGVHRPVGNVSDTGEITMPGGRQIWHVQPTSNGVLTLHDEGVLRRLSGGQSSPIAKQETGTNLLAVSPNQKRVVIAGGPGYLWDLPKSGAASFVAKLGGFSKVGTMEAAREIDFFDDYTLIVLSFLKPELLIYELAK